MCGIAGQIRFDGVPVERSLLERMGSLLEHRGRDDRGIFQEESIGLVHRRLSIIDLSEAGKQPMFIDDGQIGIIFNGEVFNYVELRQDLEKAGCRFRTHSDTEVVLQAYRAHGLKMLDLIEGMFAFALLDLRSGKLHLVRDRVGIKPLYFHQDGRALTFASEIKALVKSGVCAPAIDPVGLTDYLHIQLYTAGRTLFRGVTSVEPGCCLTMDLNKATSSTLRYWDLPTDESQLNYDDSIEQLRGLMSDAVRMWSRADVPIAAYISGGLDSSTVATLAKRHLNREIQPNLATFSSVFPDAEFPDERPFSDAVAAQIQSDHHCVVLPKDELIRAHEDLLYVLDMPVAGYSAPYRVLSRIVRRHAKVVLTGHGGDEFFCGYPKHIAAWLAMQMSEALRGRREAIDGHVVRYLAGFEKQAQHILARCLFSDERDIIRALFYRSEHLWKYVRPEIHSAVRDYDCAESLTAVGAGRPHGYLKRLLYLEVKLLLPGLLHVEDRTSMIENLESRTPFLDRRIIEFASRMPESYLLRDGLKGMIRRAVEPILPKKVTENPSKSGTMYPAAELFDREMKELVQSDLIVLDRAGLFTKPSRLMLGEMPELANKRMTWALWSLGAWFRAFGPAI